MHKDRDRHRSYTAGHGGDVGCLFCAGVKIKVAHKLVADTVYAYVDKHCAFFDHIAGDHLGLADSGREEWIPTEAQITHAANLLLSRGVPVLTD